MVLNSSSFKNSSVELYWFNNSSSLHSSFLLKSNKISKSEILSLNLVMLSIQFFRNLIFLRTSWAFEESSQKSDLSVLFSSISKEDFLLSKSKIPP